MKKKKLIATVLSASMLVGLLAGCGSSTDPAESPTGGGETTPAQGETTPAQNDVDYANFVIDPAQIPQEKLDTTLYLAVSVRGLENPYIATINEGMKLFAEYLDSIGQKYEMQVLDSQGDSAKEVDNMRQFAAKANGNAIAYADPNEDTIAYSLAEAMAESGGYLGTAWNKPADVGPSDLDPNWVIHTSPDNVVNGYNIAKALFDSMGGEGQIFVVQGLLGNTASNARYEGLQKALEEYPNIEVVADDTANWNTDEALALVEMLTEEQLSAYSLYMRTLGNRPDLFGKAQYPNASTIKQPTYYDIPPEALKDDRFAAMMEEATKYIGYPYVWGGSSPSTSFDCSGYISWVLNHSGWNVGRQTAQGLYNFCTPVSAAQVKPGDLVFFKGTYDTPGVSHCGIYVGNSIMLHCGDPISYTNLNSKYWQEHFYSYGRLP